MFYSPELLSLRKKGKLARCWLAATLSDRQFKKTVSNKIVLSIDLQVTCTEILKFVVTDSANRSSRFSLYMSAQLMYGAVKLFRIQAILFQDCLSKIRMGLNPISLTSKKKRRTGDVTTTDDMMLPDLPPITFKDIHLREDLHLLPEVDLETIKKFKLRDHVEDLNFGALTEEEVDRILLNGDDFRMCLTSDRSHVDRIDESREQHRAAENTSEVQNLGLSDRLAIDDESAVADPAARVLRTPTKRPSTAKHLDTPTKRLRRGLGQEIDAADERNAKADLHLESFADEEVRLINKFADMPADVGIRPIDETTGFPPEDPALPAQGDSAHPVQEDSAHPVQEDSALQVQEVPALQAQEDSALQVQEVPALPAQESTVNVTAPADGNLEHLETLDQEVPTAARGKRGRKIERVDLHTQLQDNETGKSKFHKPDVYTTRCVPPVPERRHGMLAAALLANPTTDRPHNRAGKSSKWASKLISDYQARIVGPFVAENDASMSDFAEVVRLADTATHSRSAELSSKRPEDTTTGLESSSQNKTAEPIPVDNEEIAIPMMPEVPEVPEAPSLADITNEPIVPNISEAPEDNVLPEIDVPPVPQNIPEISSESATMSIAKLQQSDFPTSSATNGQSTAETNTGDVDAFLPPKLRRKRSAEKKTSLEKVSTPEAIIDICESPVAVGSAESIGQSEWSKPELLAYLEVLWTDRPVVTLNDLLPPDVTRRIDAAVCFTLLLELLKEGRVVIKQRESYGPISIAKKTAGRYSMDWDDA